MNQPEVVVITGASAGVGRATARAFARRGAHIGLIARGAEGLEGAQADVERLGGRALVLPADTAHPEEVEAAARRVEREFGPIDVWINNAMLTIFSPFNRITPEEYKRVTEVTYLGYVYGTMAALKRMAPRNHGTIVQVGSALAYRSIPLQAPYCGAKAAIRAFTDSVRTELIHNGSRVHITMVQLPAINTPQFNWSRIHIGRKPRPVAPVYEPAVAARAIVWAAQHRRREIYVGISSAGIIWANKIAPKLLDHYLARVAYEGQETDERPSPERPDILFEPVDEDYGARGDFGDEAYPWSPQLWATTHRQWLILAGAGIAAAGWLISRKSKRSPSVPRYRLEESGIRQLEVGT